MSTNNSPSRSWAFTDFDTSEERQQFWLDLESKYMCFGIEEAATGRMHLQGFITFTRAYRFKQLKKLLGDVHLERAKAKDGMNYCMKDGNYTIKDSRKQGHRSDLQKAADMIVGGASMRDVAMEDPAGYIRHNRGYQALQAVLAAPRTEAPTVVWRWGPSGIGKSRWAVDTYEADDVWQSNGSAKWFDGYHGQPVAVLEEMTCEFPWKWLLRLLDRYPLRVEVKGGFVHWCPEVIVVTCINPPDVEFRQSPNVEQLLRRIDHVVEVGVDIEMDDV